MCQRVIQVNVLSFATFDFGGDWGKIVVRSGGVVYPLVVVKAEILMRCFMRRSRKYLLGFFLTSLLTVPCSAVAQSKPELTAEQLEEIFSRQKTRGLVIAPADASESQTATAETEVVAKTTYVELEKEDQVNIQVSFDFDSAALRADQKQKLATLCQVMATIDVAQFRIVGHTDASGSKQYNQRLSLLRAQEVKRHLVGECGIPTDRLEAVGVGEEFPFNADRPNADENRRVEFQALS
jgi:outer membrane protein OmpA-like peptidoglycan-associated protein